MGQCTACLKSPCDYGSGSRSEKPQPLSPVIPQNTTLLVVGLRGSGKATAITSLFGTYAESTNATYGNVITEFTFKSSGLTILKAPSFQSSINAQKNASTLVSITKYVDTKQIGITGVLITARLDDARFAGDFSDFMQQLRALKLLKTKLKWKNQFHVVVVLTHGDEPAIQLTKPLIIQSYKEAVEKVFEYKPVCLVLGKHPLSLHDMNNQINREVHVVNNVEENELVKLIREFYAHKAAQAEGSFEDYTTNFVDTDQLQGPQTYETLHSYYFANLTQ